MIDQDNFEVSVAQLESDITESASLISRIKQQRDEIEEFLHAQARRIIQENNIPLSEFYGSSATGPYGTQRSYRYEAYILEKVSDGNTTYVFAMTHDGVFFTEYKSLRKYSIHGEAVVEATEVFKEDLSRPESAKSIYRTLMRCC